MMLLDLHLELLRLGNQRKKNRFRLLIDYLVDVNITCNFEMRFRLVVVIFVIYCLFFILAVSSGPRQSLQVWDRVGLCVLIY